MKIRHALAALMLPLAATAAPVAVVDGAGTYLGFDNIGVNGTLYNVRFIEGTFNAVFGGVPQFGLEADASAAAFSLLQAVNGDAALNADPYKMFGCGLSATMACNIMTADAEFSSLPSDVDVIAVRNGREADNVLNGLNALTIDTSYDSNVDNIGPGGVHSYVWAQWTAVTSNTVPEPSSLALICLAGLAAATARRRRLS